MRSTLSANQTARLPFKRSCTSTSSLSSATICTYVKQKIVSRRSVSDSGRLASSTCPGSTTNCALKWGTYACTTSLACSPELTPAKHNSMTNLSSIGFKQTLHTSFGFWLTGSNRGDLQFFQQASKLGRVLLACYLFPQYISFCGATVLLEDAMVIMVKRQRPSVLLHHLTH